MLGRYWRISLLLVLSLLLSRPALAREVMIRDIVVTNSSTDLLLFLKVVDALSQEIIDGVQNGLSATLNFDVRVSLVREGWPDKEIIRRKVDHSVSYDSLKKEYRLLLTENGREEVVTPSLDKAKTMMEELKGAKLLPLSTLVADRQYILKVRAVLAKQDLPSYATYLVPFNNFWNVHTDWFTVPFRY